MSDEKKKLSDDALVSRMFCAKEKGLDVSRTTWQRWEEKKRVTPVKPGGTPSSRVYYAWGEVRINLLKQKP
jgi:hypothetical protein